MLWASEETTSWKRKSQEFTAVVDNFHEPPPSSRLKINEILVANSSVDFSLNDFWILFFSAKNNSKNSKVEHLCLLFSIKIFFNKLILPFIAICERRGNEAWTLLVGEMLEEKKIVYEERDESQ